MHLLHLVIIMRKALHIFEATNMVLVYTPNNFEIELQLNSRTKKIHSGISKLQLGVIHLTRFVTSL